MKRMTYDVGNPALDCSECIRLKVKVTALQEVVNEFAFNTGTDNIFCLCCNAPDGEHTYDCMVGQALNI